VASQTNLSETDRALHSPKCEQTYGPKCKQTYGNIHRRSDGRERNLLLNPGHGGDRPTYGFLFDAMPESAVDIGE
jgi:hypothetical protein